MEAAKDDCMIVHENKTEAQTTLICINKVKKSREKFIHIELNTFRCY